MARNPRVWYKAGMKKRVPGLGRAVEVGERVFLRYPNANDQAEMVRLKRRSRAHLAPWEGTPVGGGSTFTAAWFRRFLKSSRDERSKRFVLCLKETGEIIGQIGLGEICRGAFQSCYVGYWIGAEFAGQGLMTEAVGLTLRHAFEELGLHRVEANIVPRNRASIGLARKSGLRYEGTAKRYLRIAGRWEDHEHWAMTVEEWEARRAGARRRKP